jgi:hypothetical protein
LTVPKKQCRGLDEEGNICGSALVAIAGSASLFSFLFELNMLHQTWQEYPKDVDVFVSGRLSRSPVFNAWVDAQILRMANAGYVIESVQKIENSYATEDGTPIMITNVKVEGIAVIISFVQALDSADINEVMEKFDLSVVKVAYHTGIECYHCSEGTFDDLKNHITHVKNFSFAGQYPTRRERKKLESTLARTEKYSRRGFPPIALPLLLQNGEQIDVDVGMEQVDDVDLGINGVSVSSESEEQDSEEE